MTTQMTADAARITAARFPGWPTRPDRPDPNQPLVKLVFIGLSLVSYDRQLKRCEIGFVNDNDDRHPLSITITEHGNKKRVSPSAAMTVGLDTAPAVYFLEQGSEYDFKNTLDLNSRDEFWPGAKPNDGEFDRKLIVNHGTFLCLELIRYEFDRVTVPSFLGEIIGQSPKDQYPLGQFTNVLAAEIGLTGDQKVTFVTDGGPLPLPKVTGNSCTIEFNNLCNDHGHECKFDRESRFETRRGDFHFHREALNNPSPKYGLSLAAGQLTKEGLDKKTGQKPLGTELAPCMPGGLGGP